MKIVFMGTPDFAVPPLMDLISGRHEVAAVFSGENKPKGRGYVMTPPPVAVAASQNNIPLYQPTTLRDGKAAEILTALSPDIIVVAAYGKILPAEILKLPKYGCINIHASLLPRHRGAAPIQCAILDGDTTTGVTIQLMDEGVDTGDILAMRETPISEDITSGELFEQLSVAGSELLLETIDKIEAGDISPVKQDSSRATYTKKITKDMSPIDWNKSAFWINRQINGLNPWPVAQTGYGDKTMRIWRAKTADNINGECGRVVVRDRRMLVCCGEGTALELCEVQLLGAKRLTAQQFLCGHADADGMLLK